MGSRAEATVDSLLTRRPRTVGLDDTLADVRRLMAAEGIHHAVVVDEGIAVGIVSDRDVLAALSPVADNDRVARPSDVATLGKRVHQLMSRRIVSVEPSTRVADAVALMLEHGFHSLPVLDARRVCVGIVTSVDAMRWALALAADADAEADAAAAAGDAAEAA